MPALETSLFVISNNYMKILTLQNGMEATKEQRVRMQPETKTALD